MNRVCEREDSAFLTFDRELGRFKEAEALISKYRMLFLPGVDASLMRHPANLSPAQNNRRPRAVPLHSACRALTSPEEEGWNVPTWLAAAARICEVFLERGIEPYSVCVVQGQIELDTPRGELIRGEPFQAFQGLADEDRTAKSDRAKVESRATYHA